MKKIALNLAVLFLAIIALNACKDPNAPEAIAEKYLKHMAKLEWDAAKALGTEDTQLMIDQKMNDDQAQAAEGKVENMACTVEADTATCTCKLDGADRTLKLVKVDGKWLVDEKKEMPNFFDDMDFDFGDEDETEDVVEDAIEE